jgi:Tfp pilus assembly protein PilF
MVLSEARQEAIRNHLEVVITSPTFRASVRRAQLLRYLVEKTLAGEESRIGEYAIGVDVLGRPKTFDPRAESIVRTEMTRLRQKLKEYYAAEAEGSARPVVIEIPLRSYVPVFVWGQPENLSGAGASAGQPPEAASSIDALPHTAGSGVIPETGSRPRSRFSARWAVAGVVALGVVGWAIWFLAGRSSNLITPVHRALPQTTSNAQAHELYLEGASAGAHDTPEAYRQAIALFHDALQKDPQYAAAYLSVAKDEQGLILLMAQSPKQGTDEMEASLRKVLQIAPGLGEARGLLAELRCLRDWDWPAAEREYRLALDQGAPAFVHMMYGWGLATRGRFAEAHAQLRLAQDQEPLSLDPRFFEALVFYIEGRFAGAKPLLRDILELNADYLPGHGLWALLATLEGNCAEAAPHAAWFARQPAMPITKVVLGWQSACRGERAQAERYLTEAAQASGPGYASPFVIADGYAMLHEKDRVLAFLEKSAAAREPQILYLKVAPDFREERSDPRYRALERRVGLEP